MDERSDSVGFPFTTTGFKYVDGNIFSVLTMAFSSCLKACVLPLPSKQNDKVCPKNKRENEEEEREEEERDQLINKHNVLAKIF